MEAEQQLSVLPGGNMSGGEVKARRSTVTLHVVSSLDGIIAK
jgi:hypothetical protein